MSKNVKKLILKNQSDAAFYQYDPKMGFWGIPNMSRDVSCEQRRGEFIPVFHNENGNRDKPFETGKDKAKVLCFGGSHTWGAGVRAENRYSNLLEKRMGARVVNSGHCSLGLDQICLNILDSATSYAPDVIVVEQYPWSLHRILNTYVVGYVKPHFFLDGQGEIRLTKVPKLARFKFFRNIIGSAYQYRKELREFMAGIDLKSGYDPLTDPVFLLWKSTHYQYMYLLIEKILGIMRDFCVQKNIRLLFAIGAVSQQFAETSKSDLIDYSLPKKKFISLLEKLGISYVDVSEILLEQHNSSDPVIFFDGHINEKGNQIFSDALYQNMAEKGWI